MELKFDVNSALEKLAEGLGVAVENLYPILYKQALIDGVISLLGLITLVLFWVFIYKLSKGFAKSAKKDYKENGVSYSNSWIEHVITERMFQGISSILFAVFLIIVAVGTFATISGTIGNIITAFFNTEYYMIENILSKLN